MEIRQMSFHLRQQKKHCVHTMTTFELCTMSVLDFYPALTLLKRFETVVTTFEKSLDHIYFLKSRQKTRNPEISIITDNSKSCDLDPSRVTPRTRDNSPPISAENHVSTKTSVVSSKSSQSSKLSSASKLSSLIAVKRARADAARTRVQFAMKEAALTRQKAGLEADLQLLAHEKEAAAAEAEVQALESVGDSNIPCSLKDNASLEFNSLRRTQHYVQEQSKFQNTPDVAAKHSDINEIQKTDQVHHTFNPSSEYEPTGNPVLMNSARPSFAHWNTGPQDYRPLNVNAKPYYPNMYERDDAAHRIRNHPLENEINHTGELTRFLLKKDLLLSRLTTFNDRPESYASWKSSFLSVMKELVVSTVEEIDLLVKWLGCDSRRHALSIRSSNLHNPHQGLRRIWERLDERYGSPEIVEAALKSRLSVFPKLTAKDTDRYYELSDILSEIMAVKEDPKFRGIFAYYDTSSGILPIVNKLPFGIQEKWTTRASNYKAKHKLPFPPFSEFSDFIREISKVKNDPGFRYDVNADTTVREKALSKHTPMRQSVTSRKTDITDINEQLPSQYCPLHQKNHPLNQCRAFRKKSTEERKKLLKEHNICFRCCLSNKHRARDCKERVICDVCASNTHPTALHFSTEVVKSKSAVTNHGGENDTVPIITPKCTQICGQESICSSKSCAKVVLVNVYSRTDPRKQVKTYAILDEQSNRSLATSKLFQQLNIHTEEVEYTLSSCSGTVVKSGRRAYDCVVKALDGTSTLTLPPLIECNDIPNIRDEIPTPEVAMYHPHLRRLADHIPALDPDTDITLLIGRDLVEAHHVADQIIGPRNAPYAQKLPLGWVVIGEVCLGKSHTSDNVYVNKTYLRNNGRPTAIEPCPNDFLAQEPFEEDSIGKSVFARTKDDEKPGLSVEDREFLEIMDNQFKKDENGNWSAPLPFKSPRQRLPNNRVIALKRAQILSRNLQKNPQKRDHFTTFMQGIFENGHAEVAPNLTEEEECWYLPVFGVYHPKKPDQIRGVFDSSAKYENVSLNDVLLTGPDLTNSLLGILIRFRKEQVAITADIQQMFYCFKVRKDHRNFLRFLWYRDNNPQNELTEYRMCVHVFGNSPSPAIATYGLRKTATNSQQLFGKDVVKFVSQNFYVDDGLVSLPSGKEAADLMRRTQTALKTEGNLHLHKIASNCHGVMEAFPSEELAKELKELNLSKDDLPTQRSLGLNWNLESDVFSFQVSSEEKAFSRRGVLSTVNSLYDPLGFLSPVTIQGKLILRDLMSGGIDWDEPLPPEKEAEWRKWKESLPALETIQIPRMYLLSSLNSATKSELHVYSDASENAIAAVAYLVADMEDNTRQTGFILGKAKVAPKHGHTIPRLELCAAVLAVEISEIITEQLHAKLSSIRFFTDSKIVLGYIHNKKRRFYTYVSNRVERIRKSTTSEQWSYVRTEMNPADCATRSVLARDMQTSRWLKGPPPTSSTSHRDEHSSIAYPLCEPNNDKEIRPEVNVLKTTLLNHDSLHSHRFERFSSWMKLVNAIVLLHHVVASWKGTGRCRKWHVCDEYKSVEKTNSAERLIIREVQYESYPKEIDCLQNKSCLPKESKLISLDPILDEDGILRVGGRLNRSTIPSEEKNPLIIPGKHHIATLLVRQKHEDVKHQGRHFTEGAVRAAGYWITGGKRLINKIIHKCIRCRKLRGSTGFQKMSDLPHDRLDPAPAFTYVGVDTFGPWSVITRKTRGGQANSKRWAIMFTCLTCRAIHIEVVEELTSSAFINALRRFISIRGNVKEFRSDRGTNFVGAVDDLKIDSFNVESRLVKEFLYNNRTVWIFNPPHSSHMGGAWERMIGITRRILDSLMADVASKNLTHDVLTTFMAEVCAIVNSRPLVPVSADPESPEILSPSLLLTQKTARVTDTFYKLDSKDMYKEQWKRVQVLAEMFWRKWRREYLNTLQTRRKWQQAVPNIENGDVVLLKDKTLHRNDWSTGIVVQTFPSTDNRVRKVQVRVIKDDKPVVYTRPVTECVMLLSQE